MSTLGDEMLTLTHATERDVDLIIVEELKCSSEFTTWFVQQIDDLVGRTTSWQKDGVTHSARRIHNRREIDISLHLAGSASQTVFLIENKLDTDAQPLQAESYRAEAEAMVSAGKASACVTVLIAPKTYLESASSFAAKFDATLTYEAISEFLRARAQRVQGELGRRLQHRHELLNQAVTKARRGYQAVPLAQIEAFNAAYVTLMHRERLPLEPGPAMLREGRPGESKTMIFAPSALPKWPFLPQTRLVHQLREGNANINFYGWGELFTRLAATIASDLEGTPYRPVPTVNKRVGGNSGLMLVADTPRIDNLKSFEEQRDLILEGMRVTAGLRLWFISHRTQMEHWAELARR